MLTNEDANDLAYGFVVEYLERAPEYIDVVEFVDDNAPEDLDPETADKFLEKVYQYVNNYLDDAKRGI